MTDIVPRFDRAEFARKLQQARTLRGLNMRDAADAAGVSAATISRAERQGALDVESWMRLAYWIDAKQEAA